MPSGFVLLIIVKCRRERDELKEGLLHKKKSGLDCFENFQSMQIANETKIKKGWAKTKSGEQAGKYASES